MTVPASRSLPVVLRAALAPRNTLRVIAGEYAGTSIAPGYGDVIVHGETVSVPILNGVPIGAPGSVAYLLADDTRMWLLGTVSAAPVRAPTLITGTGAPAAAAGVDGDTYLDTATGRMYGPKTSGAWPASPIGRLMPAEPTYAQLKTG